MANKFGSVAWQQEQADAIMAKVCNGIALDDFDKAFITVQQQHLINELKPKEASA